MNTRRLGLLTVLVMTAGCASFGPPKHPAFKERQPRIQRIGVTPAHVEVYRVSFQGDKDMMYDLLPPVQRQAQEELVAVLKKRGYAVETLDLATAPNAEELRTSLHKLQELFEKYIKDYQRKMIRPKFEYSLGGEVNLLADATHSDAVILMRCVAMKKTGGEIAKDVVKSAALAVVTGAFVMQAPSVAIIQIGVIDGNAGELLWYTDNIGDSGVDVAKEKKLRTAVRKQIRRFPKASHAVPAALPAQAQPASAPTPSI